MPTEVARPEGGMSVERLSDGAIEIIDELHTERLDYTSEYLPLIDAANKLDAYEDTGLEPEEIEQLKGEVFGLKVDKQELEQYRALGPIDRLLDLVEADREGRCKIFNRKIGETIYVIGESKIVEAKITEIYILDDSKDVEYLVSFNCDESCKGCPFYAWDQDWEGEWCCDCEYGDGAIFQKDFGKTVFLTREAAEAALKGE